MPYKDKDRRREYQRQWMAERRAEFLSGKMCEFCGSGNSLELHHIDPDQKVDHKVWSWSTLRREEELSKCIVLCEDCHTQQHRPEHGTNSRYSTGCHCESCRRSHAAYERIRVSRNK